MLSGEIKNRIKIMVDYKAEKKKKKTALIQNINQCVD